MDNDTFGEYIRECVRRLEAGATESDLTRYLSEHGVTGHYVQYIGRIAQRQKRDSEIVSQWREKRAHGATVEEFVTYLAGQGEQWVSGASIVRKVFDMGLGEAREHIAPLVKPHETNEEDVS